MQKKYIWPKLSMVDLGFITIAGHGLGNLLLMYGFALKESKEYNLPLIWPTWTSFHAGAILRHELDKRTYRDLFRNNTNCIGGLRKMWLLCTRKKVSRWSISSPEEVQAGIIEYFGMDDYFSHILGDYQMIWEDILTNLNPKYKKGLEFDFSNSLSVHIRLGDFAKVSENELKSGRECSRIPVEWYRDRIREVRSIIGEDIKTYVFSDGTDEELSEVLSLPNVERAFFGSSIADILALSQAKLFIASGSTFSMWARYLGRMSVITYENQLLQSLKLPGDSFFECETADVIPESYHDSIKKLYK